MHFLSRTAAALTLSSACFLAGSGSALAAQTASLSVDAMPSEASVSISPRSPRLPTWPVWSATAIS